MIKKITRSEGLVLMLSMYQIGGLFLKVNVALLKLTQEICFSSI